MTIESKLSDRWFRVDQALAENCDANSAVWDCFDPASPSLNAQPVMVGGRAAAWFVKVGPFDAVLRHYRRGGLVAKLIKDRYWWTGIEKTRSCQEFALLQVLWRAGMSVPRPLGAAIWRKGLFYRAALLTQRIAHAQPLAHGVELETWTRAGVLIAQMHRFGVWHADLNVYNILFDDQHKVWLIDFDRGRLGALSAGQRAENMSRLLRSLKKLSLPQEHDYWRALSEGYRREWSATVSLK